MRLLYAPLFVVFLVVSSSGDPAAAQAIRLAPDGLEEDDAFGLHVALDGSTAIVTGAVLDEVWVYSLDPATGTWEQTAGISGEPGVSQSLAVEGDRVLLGRSRDPVSGRPGVVVYERDPTSGEWGAVDALLDPVTPDQMFGWSAALAGDVAVVGERGVGGTQNHTGAASIFERDPATGEWADVVTLTPADGATADEFGYDVDISGGTVVVGAPFHDDSGAVYIYEQSEAGAWDLAQKLVTPDAGDDWFGYAVAVHGTTVVIGAPLDDEAGHRAGAVHVYTREETSGTWEHVAKLIGDDAEESDLLGVAVAYEGGGIVAGASALVPSTSTGKAYVFGRDESGTWGQTARLVPSGTTSGDFGESVAISEDRALVGAPESDGLLGAAFIFDGVVPVERDRQPVARGGVGPVYPNPTTGRALIDVTVTEPTGLSVSVVDALGRLVQAEPTRQLGAGDHRLSVDLGGLAPGVYGVAVTDGTGRGQHRTVVVQ